MIKKGFLGNDIGNNIACPLRIEACVGLVENGSRKHILVLVPDKRLPEK